MRNDRDHRHGMAKFWTEASLPLKALIVAGCATAFVALVGLVGWIFMSLWNALMPSIFGLRAIGYWQGWGLMILASMLFKRSPGSHRISEERRKRHLRERMREAAESLGAEDTQGAEGAAPKSE